MDVWWCVCYSLLAYADERVVFKKPLADPAPGAGVVLATFEFLASGAPAPYRRRCAVCVVSGIAHKNGTPVLARCCFFSAVASGLNGACKVHLSK